MEGGKLELGGLQGTKIFTWAPSVSFEIIYSLSDDVHIKYEISFYAHGHLKFVFSSIGTQEEAAEAYDIAAIKFRGLNAVTNFDMSRYDVKSIIESSTLPIGGAAKRLKEAEQTENSVDGRRTDDDNITSHLTDGISSYGSHHHGWPTIAFPPVQALSMHYPYGQQRGWCKQEHDTISSHGLQDRSVSSGN